MRKLFRFKRLRRGGRSRVGNAALFVVMIALSVLMIAPLVYSVINSFKVFREAYLIAGDYPHDSIYMLQHLFNNWFVSLDIQKMSAASVLLETAVLFGVLLWRWRRAGHD